MKKLILEYLANFISRWETASDEQIDGLVKEYDIFTSTYKLPSMSADELKSDIKNGNVIIEFTEEEQEEDDLFKLEFQDLPEELRIVLAKHTLVTCYEECKALTEDLKLIGYTVEYGLDAEPYNLRKIKQENKLIEGTLVETTVFMSTEDVGGEEDIQVGTIGLVFHEPSDEEDSIGVIIHGTRYYISQDAVLITNKALSSPSVAKEKWMNKLEESKNQPRKFQAHDTPWDFVEEYYPNYSSADNICRALDLYLKKEQNGDTLNDEDDEELTYIMEDVYQTAINAFIQSQNK